jgi:dephospho-CoA kinase
VTTRSSVPTATRAPDSAARPRLIGLTGGIGAGKTEALTALGRLGAATISSDEVVHELLGDDQMRDALVSRFGEAVAPGGQIDRGLVAERAFKRPQDLAWLERELHPRVGERIAAWVAELPADTRVAVVEVPLLFETAMEGMFDQTVCVVARDELRERRASDRGLVKVSERERRQLAQAEKAAKADHVVVNDGSLDELLERLADLLERWQ